MLSWEESYKVNYRLEQDTTPENLILFTCIPIEEILDARKSYNLEPEMDQVIVSQFIAQTYSLLNRTFHEQLETKRSRSNEGEHDAHYNVSSHHTYRLPLFKKNGMIYVKYVCFRTDQQLFSNLYFLRKFNLKLYASTNRSDQGQFPHFVSLIRNVSPFSEIKIVQEITQSLGEPYSNCTDEWKWNSKTYRTKFDCLNDCLKTKERYIRFLYSDADDGYVNLSQKFIDTKNKDECYRHCEKDSCTLEIYTGVMNYKYNAFGYMLRAYLHSKLDFYLSFFGLIGTFLSVSVNEQLPYILCYAVKLICVKLERPQTLHTRLRIWIKIVLFILSLLSTVIICLYMICTYDQIKKEPIRSIITKFSNDAKPFSVVMCSPIQYIMYGQIRRDGDEEIMTKFTLQAIVNLTDSGLDKLVESIYLTYGSRKRSVLYRKSDRIYFRKSYYKKLKKNELFSRCFRIEIERKELAYESLLSIAMLVIKLRVTCQKDYLTVHIVDVDQEFNLHNSIYKEEFKILKFIKFAEASSARSNCSRYSELKCKSRASCISSCSHQKYLENHQAIAVTNRTMFDKDISDLNQIADYRFTDRNEPEIEEQCLKEFPKYDCTSIHFIDSIKAQINYKDRYEINLSFEKTEIHEQIISWDKLVLSIINVLSLFFGLNVAMFTQTLAKLVSSTLTRRRSRMIGMKKHLKRTMIAICACGFITHLFVIFYAIVNETFIASGYFDRNRTIDLPDLTFCFDFSDKQIDANHRLTGYYLSNLTDDISFKTVFKEIAYITTNKTLKHLSPDELLVSDKFRTHTFIFNKMKCLVINSLMPYNDENYYFDSELYPFKIYLTDHAKKREIYFLGKKKFSKEMNEIYKFIFNENSTSNFTYKHLVTIILMENVYDDLFRYLKNPMLLFNGQEFDDTTTYLKEMHNLIQTKYGFLTTAFPLEQQSFDLEINDLLFEQFYLHVSFF